MLSGEALPRPARWPSCWRPRCNLPRGGLGPGAAKELDAQRGRSQGGASTVTHTDPKGERAEPASSPLLSPCAAWLQRFFFTLTIVTCSCCHVSTSHLLFITKHRLPKQPHKPLLSVKPSAWVAPECGRLGSCLTVMQLYH